MRNKKRSMIAGALLGTIVAGGLLVSAALSGEKRSSSWQANRQEFRQELDDVGVILDSPSQDAQPAVSPDEAAEIARMETPHAGEKSAASAQFASFQDGASIEDATSKEPIEVWIVTFDGACPPIYGPYGTKAGCAADEISAVVDARSGKWLMAYYSQED